MATARKRFAVLIGSLLILCASIFAPMRASSSSSEVRGGGGFRPWIAAAGGVIVDIAPYGVEKWSPSLFTKVSVSFTDTAAVSLRPAFMYENGSFGFRGALTLDVGSLYRVERTRGISPYFGGGIAWYKNGSNMTDPFVSGGVDFRFSRFLIVTGGNLLFKEGDTDVELLAGIGIGFQASGRK